MEKFVLRIGKIEQQTGICFSKESIDNESI